MPLATHQGIDTDSPVLQIGSLVFKGKYENIVGTGLIFGKLQNGREKGGRREGKRARKRERERHVRVQ